MRHLLPLLLAVPAVAAPPEGRNGLLADLAQARLDAEGLGRIEGLVEALPDDPGTVDYLTSVFECALPGGTEITVGSGDRTVTFRGYWGFAPEWLEGPCEEACQEWVSACLMTHINDYGLPVDIFLAGTNEHLQALGVRPEDRGFAVLEGAYYGNVFQRPALMYACRGHDRDALALTWRVCSRPGARCGFEIAGPCGPVDGETGADATGVCEVTPEGFYRNCRTSRGADGRTYSRVLNVYMRPTSFGGALVESCGEPPPSTPAPTSVGEQADPCLHDVGCAEGLYCDVSFQGQGLCTRFCGEGDTEDEAACGAGGTCLRSAGKNFCTRACTPGDGTSCAPGQVCTGLWLQVSPADDPGCLPFCATDDQCGPGQVCHVRSGTCTAPTRLEGREDGEPCDPSGPEVCRGLCFQVDDDPTHGMCASLINRAVADDCPDRPGTMTPLRPNADDDLAVCIYRGCDADEDCTAPLRCIRRPLTPGQCGY